MALFARVDSQNGRRMAEALARSARNTSAETVTLARAMANSCTGVSAAQLQSEIACNRFRPR
jgi:hypothetical protein